MNSNLQEAKRQKNDEFYTLYKDIEKEIQYYKDDLKGKIVFCNTDDYKISNFVEYLKDNFHNLGLKKLYSLGLSNELCIYDGVNKTVIEADGDFRSDDSIEVLKLSDIVITNPPFSLFREYVSQLIEYKKVFLIMGNNNAITYKDIFPLIKDNKMWLGHHTNKTLEFRLPDHYEKWDRIDEGGVKYGKVPAISWFTNMNVSKKHEDINLIKNYYDNEENYPKYDNYNAIEVSRVKDIPKDYKGVMGVPITFLTRYNPNQFEIVGITDRHNSSGLKTKTYTEKDHKNYSDLNGRSVSINPDGTFKYYYARILIKNKKPETKKIDD